MGISFTEALRRNSRLDAIQSFLPHNWIRLAEELGCVYMNFAAFSS